MGQIKTCPKCKTTIAETQEEIERLFGLRIIKTNISLNHGAAPGKPKPLADKPMIVTDLESTRSLYMLFYPKDTNANKRSWRFCVQKISLSEQAKDKLGVRLKGERLAKMRELL